MRKKLCVKSQLSLAKTVSRKHSYNVISDQKIEELKQLQMLKKSENKMNWGMYAYNDWKDYKLETLKYNFSNYNADLCDLSTVTKEDLEYLICHFIHDITKQKDTGPYLGKTLYQMVVVIQKYLNTNKILWRLADRKGNEFLELCNVLDNVMKERSEMAIGTIKKQAEFISYEYEELWDRNILDEDMPDKLRTQFCA